MHAEIDVNRYTKRPGAFRLRMMSESKTMKAYKCLINIPVHGLPNPFLYLDISHGHIRIAIRSSKASIPIVAIFTVVLTIHLGTINGSQPVFFVVGCRADSNLQSSTVCGLFSDRIEVPAPGTPRGVRQ